MTLAPPRWTLLRHTLEGGAWHLDWMVGPWPGLSDESRDDPADQRLLRSWRLMEDPLPATAFNAEDAPHHRLAYLSIDAIDLANGRGRVQRLRAGQAHILHAAESRVRIHLRDQTNGEAVLLEGLRQTAYPDRWTFRRAGQHNRTI